MPRGVSRWHGGLPDPSARSADQEGDCGAGGLHRPVSAGPPPYDRTDREWPRACRADAVELWHASDCGAGLRQTSAGGPAQEELKEARKEGRQRADERLAGQTLLGFLMTG